MAWELGKGKLVSLVCESLAKEVPRGTLVGLEEGENAGRPVPEENRSLDSLDEDKEAGDRNVDEPETR